MKLNKFISLAVISCLMCTICSGFALAATAGSADDPLITKSYIDNSYPPMAMSNPKKLLSESMQVLKYKLEQAKKSPVSDKTFMLIESGEGLSLKEGSGLLLLSGSAKLSSCTGTVIDLTSGSTVSSGQTLSAMHQYLAAENSNATVTVTAKSKVLTFGSVTGGSLPTFSDVNEGSWYYSDVVYAVKRKLIDGRSPTIFDPEANLSVCEAIKLAACIHQLYNEGAVTLTNGSPAWYDSYVSYALKNGLITHTYDNYDAKITRTEYVSIFYRTMPAGEYSAINSVPDNSIPDVKTSDANAAAIYTFYRAGILNGSTANGDFKPSENIRRSEVAAIMTRMFKSEARISFTLR